MPGTKASGRPGGNPDIKNYGFKTDRPEPLREKLQLRISASMKEQLQSRENWQNLYDNQSLKNSMEISRTASRLMA